VEQPKYWVGNYPLDDLIYPAGEADGGKGGQVHEMSGKRGADDGQHPGQGQSDVPSPREPRTRIPMTERRATESVGAALRLAHGSCSGRVTLVGYMGNQTNVGVRYGGTTHYSVFFFLWRGSSARGAGSKQVSRGLLPKNHDRTSGPGAACTALFLNIGKSWSC
jgi:hypothetical protein